jgi:succinoglycan biosynthesis transport protein ExoP
MIVAGAVLYLVPARYDAVATASIDPGFIDPITQQGGVGSTALMQGNMLQLVQSQRVALDVVDRLKLTANPLVQEEYRKSGYLGRESVQDWYAAVLAKNVRPQFETGSNVLTIKFGSADPNVAALVANAFLAAAVDAAVAMKASMAEQTSKWFAPQLADLRKELETARQGLQKFRAESNVTLPTGNFADEETSLQAMVTQNLSSAKAKLTLLQSQLSNGATDLSVDPSDPDLLSLAKLKEQLSSAELALEVDKSSMGLNNPKVTAHRAFITSLSKQIPEATEKAKEKAQKYLKERIVETRSLIASLEAEEVSAQKALTVSQVQRDQLEEHYRTVSLLIEQLEAQQKAADQAKLHSKLTFADIADLDRAVPPVEASFPNQRKTILIAVSAGLVLGLGLLGLTEMLDRRVRHPIDLEIAAPAPFLGTISNISARKLQVSSSLWKSSVRPNARMSRSC